IDLRIGPTAQAATLEEGQIVLSLSDGTTKTCQMAVNCTGRIPDLDGLDLNAGTVAHSRHGIEVNDFLQSITNPAVYAAGDAADTPFGLTPTATIESIALAENILNGNTSMPDFEGVPSVCFTLPPIASAGLAVEMARQMNIPHRVKTGDLSQSFPWKRLGEQAGGYRLVLSEEEDRILGAHLFGHAAEELINTFAAFIRLKTPLSGLRKTVWAYPTCGYYLKYMLD
ncbi:MAG: FAD-dependent oxidoreductase, partial [Proteobacteria bacterium]|nr:FAD-dependent oxidoreductase [Pseudomonadota bacterium]